MSDSGPPTTPACGYIHHVVSRLAGTEIVVSTQTQLQLQKHIHSLEIAHVGHHPKLPFVKYSAESIVGQYMRVND
jgi:hypothetical protein